MDGWVVTFDDFAYADGGFEVAASFGGVESVEEGRRSLATVYGGRVN